MKGESMLAFHNGRFVPYSELRITPHDAGFVFGATVTDFCRTYAHKLFRWPDHLARLRRDAEACFIPLLYTDAELTAAAEELVSENAKQLPPGDDLALITFATPGPLGYMVGDTSNGPPTVAMHTFPIPKERYRRFFTEGVTLAYAGELPTWNDHGPLTTAKHRSRIHWWKAQHSDSGRAAPLLPSVVPILRQGDGNAPDTGVGAVLAVRDGVVYLPRQGDTFYSICAYRVLTELCDRIGLRYAFRREWDWWGDEPTTDREWLLTGSAFGIAGVRGLKVYATEHRFEWPGPVFTKLAAAWSELVGVDIVKQFVG